MASSGTPSTARVSATTSPVRSFPEVARSFRACTLELRTRQTRASRYTSGHPSRVGFHPTLFVVAFHERRGWRAVALADPIYQQLLGCCCDGIPFEVYSLPPPGKVPIQPTKNSCSAVAMESRLRCCVNSSLACDDGGTQVRRKKRRKKRVGVDGQTCSAVEGHGMPLLGRQQPQHAIYSIPRVLEEQLVRHRDANGSDMRHGNVIA